jgi:hydroxymethylglutaryl-CoA lyase
MSLFDSVDVILSDCVLRDGLQIVKTPVPIEDKKVILDLLVKSGVRNIEVTSMVPPRLVPQFEDASEMIGYANAIGVLLPTVLVPNFKGAKQAIEAGAKSLVVPVSVSETHSNKNVRKSRADQIDELARIRALIDEQPVHKRPQLAVGVSTAFGCSYEGEVPEDEVFRMVDRCMEVGVDEVGLADTVGYGTPPQISSAFKRLFQRVGDEALVRAHFHDTFGFALANAFAALEAGVTIFDGSLCGLGGCPFAPNATGNATLEDLVLLFQKCGLKTGIDFEALLQGQGLLRSLLPDMPLYGVVNRAGRFPADFEPERIA